MQGKQASNEGISTPRRFHVAVEESTESPPKHGTKLQGLEAWFHALGGSLCSLLRLHGSVLGWICLHYLPASPACLCPSLYGAIQPKALCQLHQLVCSGHPCQHADSLRGILASQDQRAYAGPG